jgi:hypothetical protein
MRTAEEVIIMQVKKGDTLLERATKIFKISITQKLSRAVSFPFTAYILKNAAQFSMMKFLRITSTLFNNALGKNAKRQDVGFGAIYGKKIFIFKEVRVSGKVEG